MKELGEDFKKQFTCSGEGTKNCMTFPVLIEKKVTRTAKNRQEITKLFLTYYNLLIVQDL